VPAGKPASQSADLPRNYFLSSINKASMSNTWETAKTPPDSVIQSNVRTESNVGALLICGRGSMCFFGSAGQKWIETPWQMPLILLSSAIKFCLSNFGFAGRESRILRSRGQFVDSSGQCNYKTHFPR
jgi:hypothetical protein